MIVPLSVLDNLKCSSCRNVLSCGPVLIKEDGTNICGRCTELDPTMPNAPYNALAELCVFPCKYEVEGCIEKITFGTMLEHEAECEFKTYKCPIEANSGCKWVGTKTKVLAHCRQCHPENTLSHPAEMEHNVRENSYKTFIITVFEAIFLIYVKVSLTNRCIYHCVRKLGQLTPNRIFRYKLNIENDSGNIIRKGDVISQGFLMLSECESIAIDLNLLTDVLAGIEKTKFSITIRELLKCFICKEIKIAKQFKYFDEKYDIFYCATCAATLFHCCNISKGCMLTGKKQISTHEKYFCIFNVWCQECKEDILESYMLLHLQNVLHKNNEFQHLFDKYWTVGSSQETVTMCSHGEAFLLSYLKEESGLHRFYIQGRHDLLRILCTLNLRNPGTKYLGQFVMSRVYSVNYSQFLWECLILDAKLQPFIDDVEFQMGATIIYYS